jgi:hypothetical protein
VLSSHLSDSSFSSLSLDLGRRGGAGALIVLRPLRSGSRRRTGGGALATRSSLASAASGLTRVLEVLVDLPGSLALLLSVELVIGSIVTKVPVNDRGIAISSSRCLGGALSSAPRTRAARRDF